MSTRRYQLPSVLMVEDEAIRSRDAERDEPDVRQMRRNVPARRSTVRYRVHSPADADIADPITTMNR